VKGKKECMGCGTVLKIPREQKRTGIEKLDAMFIQKKGWHWILYSGYVCPKCFKVYVRLLPIIKRAMTRRVETEIKNFDSHAAGT